MAASKVLDNAEELGAISSGFDWRHSDSSAKAKMHIEAGFLGEVGIPPLDHTLASRGSAERGSQSRCNQMIEESANRSGRTAALRFHSLGWENGVVENCLIAKSD